MADSTNASAIIDALKDNANQTLSSILGSTPLQAFAIGSLGNFPYNWENTMNVTQFNHFTYNWIISNLKAGTVPLQQDASSSFTNQYIKAITAISYGLSTADQATLNQASANATQQAAAVQKAWLEAFGTLPTGTNPINDIAGQIATVWAEPPTTLQTIQNSIDLSSLLNKTPAAGQPVLPVFVNWLNAISSVLSLMNSVAVNNAYLGRAKRAAQSPTKENGGLLLDDGKYYPAYQVATQVPDILNSLKSGTPSVDLNMTVMRTTASEFNVKVSTNVGVSIPITDFITLGIGGSSNYFSSDIATSNNQTEVKMHFPGVNLVNFGPVAFQQAGASSSWFWMDPIREAISNRGKDVSGYKFSPDPQIDFSSKGRFGYIMGVAISSYPTITIVVKGDNYHKIQQTFEQSVNTSVSFLGIKLASASESTYSNKVQVDASSKTVTITISPPPTLVAGTVNASTGWILGVQTMFPAA